MRKNRMSLVGDVVGRNVFIGRTSVKVSGKAAADEMTWIHAWKKIHLTERDFQNPLNTCAFLRLLNANTKDMLWFCAEGIF